MPRAIKVSVKRARPSPAKKIPTPAKPAPPPAPAPAPAESPMKAAESVVKAVAKNHASQQRVVPHPLGGTEKEAEKAPFPLPLVLAGLLVVGGVVTWWMGRGGKTKKAAEQQVQTAQLNTMAMMSTGSFAKGKNPGTQVVEAVEKAQANLDDVAHKEEFAKKPLEDDTDAAKTEIKRGGNMSVPTSGASFPATEVQTPIVAAAKTIEGPPADIKGTDIMSLV